MLAHHDAVAPTAPKLNAAVMAAFAAPPIEVSVASASKVCPGRGRDRSATVEAVVGGEPLSLALVAEGFGDLSVVDWCQANTLPLFVRLAGDDPTTASLQQAGFRTFQEIQREAMGIAGKVRAGCMLTLCVINRVRNECVTFNVGAAAAIFFGPKKSPQPLTEDHRLDSCPAEQARLREMGVQIARAQNSHGAAEGPLRAWPGGLTCTRAIGFVGVEGMGSAVPSCSTFTLERSSGDLLLCSDGVWNELLVSAVAGLARSCPTPASAARLVVDSAASQHLAYDQQGYGNPRDDITCIVLRISTPPPPRSVSSIKAPSNPLSWRRWNKSSNEPRHRKRDQATPVMTGPSTPGLCTPTISPVGSRTSPDNSITPYDLNAGPEDAGLVPLAEEALADMADMATEPTEAVTPAEETQSPAPATSFSQEPSAHTYLHKSSSCPANLSDAERGGSHSSTRSTPQSALVNELLRSMPAQYERATEPADRMEHAVLLQALRASTPPPALSPDAPALHKGGASVHLSWAQMPSAEAPHFTLRLVFRNRRGSLGVITSTLAELGVNISRAATFTSKEDEALNLFTIDRMDDGLAANLHARLSVAFGAPRTSSEDVDCRAIEAAEAALSVPSSPAVPGGVQNGIKITQAEPAPSSMMAGLAPEERRMLEQLHGQFSNLRVRSVIAEGSSCEVWDGDWAGARVVVKVLREQASLLEGFLTEVDTWRRLRHPNICSLLGVCLVNDRPSMVLEYVLGGSLYTLLHDPEHVPRGAMHAPALAASAPSQAPHDIKWMDVDRLDLGEATLDVDPPEIEPELMARIVTEVALALAYLHRSGIMHRDIKSDNVLLDECGHAKLTDFGISTAIGRADYTAETGTYRQMAPEVILHKAYNYKCDVYSYGVLLWEALHRQVAFADSTPLQAAFAVAMQNGRPSMALREVYASYGPLVVACWHVDPEVRPEMDAVVKATAECASAVEGFQARSRARRSSRNIREGNFNNEQGSASNSSPRAAAPKRSVFNTLTGAFGF